jgi:hypothetical protein
MRFPRRGQDARKSAWGSGTGGLSLARGADLGSSAKRPVVGFAVASGLNGVPKSTPLEGQSLPRPHPGA